jgi:catechol 2,3-dioxygenase-like lactoylglutathione lyase family enzyme
MINIYSHGVMRLVEFYQGLGFDETFRTPKQGMPVHVELSLGHFKIGVASVDAAISVHGLSPDLGGRPIEIVFWSGDVDGDCSRLAADGAPLLSRPHDFLGGRLRAAWIADPDGNPIQLVQRR